MTDKETSHRRAIDYLLGIDPVQRWPQDLGFSPSGEDYGDACAWRLSHAETPTDEMLAALIHGALKHDDERVRFSCAQGVAEIDTRLGKLLYFIQTLDKEEYVRDNAFESLWHIDHNDQNLARRACDRLLSDPDSFVRDTAKRYKAYEDEDPIRHVGPRGGHYTVDKDGNKHYTKDQ